VDDDEGPAARHAGPRQKKRAMRRWGFAVGGLKWLFVAIILLGVGYAEAEDTYVLQHRGVVATGTVLHKNVPLKGSTSITVRFVTAAGKTVKADTSNFLDAEVGQTIQVVYDPADPTRMQAADWGFDYWLPGIMFGGALAMVAAAIFHFWRRPD
jgi:Protein of unknown function (DUF3592)